MFRFKNIEFLRIAFMIAVVSYHFFGRLNIWNNGLIAVEFFFILSGFFLNWTFNAEKTVLEYIKSKYVRFMSLMMIGSLLWACSVGKIAEQFFFDLFFLARTGIYHGDGYNPSGWYLSVLFWSGLFYFYLFKICKSRELLNFIIGLITFIGYIVVCNQYDGQIGQFINVRFVRGFTGLGLGYFVCEAVRLSSIGNINLSVQKKVFYTFLEVGSFFYAFATMFLKHAKPDNCIFIIISFAVLIYTFIVKKGYFSNFLERDFWSKYSYYVLSIYLTHQVVTVHWLPYFIKKTGDFVFVHKSCAVFGVYLFCILLGVLIQILYDKIKKSISFYLR